MKTSTKPTAAAADGRSDRGARRRARTRGRLLAAARELFAKQGVATTTINEITDRADLGFGSFYNYFEDKEAVVDALLREMAERQAEEIDQLTGGLDDPAEVVAVAHRHFVRLTRTDPVWARLLVRLDATHRLLTEVHGPRSRADIERGIESGRFAVPDIETAAQAAGGALLNVMRAELDGMLPEDADRIYAELVLRMLGLPAAGAAEVAARPLPG